MNIEERKDLISLDTWLTPQMGELIEQTLASIDGKRMKERSTRNDYYALKAEYRNYRLLKNLFLTQPTLDRARTAANVPLSGTSQFMDTVFEEQVVMAAIASRKIIHALMKRLNGGGDKPFRNDSLQIRVN